MKNKFTAFTLGEVLVTLAIVGVIAALILPTIKQIQPDRQKVLFKKAYTTIEIAVTELVNDAYLYPEATGFVGLDNTSEVKLNDKIYIGNTKFCKLFALKVNTIHTSDTEIKCPAGTITKGAAGTPSFVTNDGIEYYIPSSTFATDTRITIDINGAKSPNCKANEGNCPKPDRYTVLIAPDGGVKVDGTLEKSFLKSSTITKD